MGVGGMSVRVDSDVDGEGEEEEGEAGVRGSDDDDDDDGKDSSVCSGNTPEGVIADAEVGVAVVVAYPRLQIGIVVMLDVSGSCLPGTL